MSHPTQMNGLPLVYAVLFEAPGKRFVSSSHTKIERARAVVREEVRFLSPDWKLYLVKLEVPGIYSQFGPLPRFEILEGPVAGTQRI